MKLALKKTGRFYAFVLLLIIIVISLTFLFGNTINDLQNYVIPFIIGGPIIAFEIN